MIKGFFMFVGLLILIIPIALVYSIVQFFEITKYLITSLVERFVVKKIIVKKPIINQNSKPDVYSKDEWISLLKQRKKYANN